jgi:hypothetical protein
VPLTTNKNVGFSPCGTLPGAYVSRFLRDVGDHYQARRLGDDVLENRIWQPRFYDFKVWTEPRARREATLPASQSSAAGTGEGTGRVALEKFSLPAFGESSTSE